jgi:uncharacterized protein with FMN-binding domain
MSPGTQKMTGPSLRRAPLLALAGAAAGFGTVLGLHLGAAAPVSPPGAAPGQPAGPGGTGKHNSASTAPAPTPAAAGGGGAARSATGPGVNFGYGTIAVKVTVAGSRIVNVSVPKLSTLDPTSQQIAAQAIPMLRSQVLAAHSARIYGVSGATYTSEGYARSLQAALTQLHKP